MQGSMLDTQINKRTRYNM